MEMRDYISIEVNYTLCSNCFQQSLSSLRDVEAKESYLQVVRKYVSRMTDLV